MWTQPVKADTAQLRIPLDNLYSLPEGASYTGKQGRANVRVTLSGVAAGERPTLLIESSCDSLQGRCYWYSEQNDSLREQVSLMQQAMRQSQLDSSNEAKCKQPPNAASSILIWIVMGGVLLILTGVYHYKRNQNS